MAFEISGYVLESIRVGQSNSPFTQTPDNLISDQGSFDTAYPSDESEPRTDYMVMVLSEGSNQPGLLVNAEFGWTKNEVIQRFDYSARQGRFKALPGSTPVEVGVLGLDSNTDRLQVRAPSQAAPLLDAPYRLSVGSTGSGDTWTVAIVANDAGFTAPASVPAGTAELSLETGNLNWNDTDLTTHQGQSVRFQRQQFYDYAESTGRLGLPSETLILNPLPGPGQHPLLRFGFGFYLETVEVVDEGSFTTPGVGTVEWARDTGLLNFHSSDITTYVTTPVYYDGVLFDRDLQLPREVLGDIATPSVITLSISLGKDLIFTLPNANPYYQFPQVTYLDNASFSSGSTGVVQVDPDTGDVQFSTSDQAKYAGEDVTLVSGDLPIERGVSIRMLRTPVNLDGSGTSKDVTALYTVEGAIWADPIIGAPQVFLPSIPVDDTGYPFVVKVIQGQGTFTTNNLPRLDTVSPPAGFGYYIDFDEGVLYYANRQIDVLVPILQRTPSVLLPDPLVLEGNVTLEIETAPGSGTFTLLTVGVDALFDQTSGQVTLLELHGGFVAEGTTGEIVLPNTLADPNADFITDGVLPGHFVQVTEPDTVEGVYTIDSVDSATEITFLEDATVAASGVIYTILDDREVLADRYWDEVSLVDPSTKVERIRGLGSASNAPRLNVPTAYVYTTGIRFGPADSGTFATMVVVPDDGSFTAPPAGTVEISEDTGNLNFSAADLGTAVYWVRELVQKVDYILSAGLGLIQFTDRMLTYEEVRVTYTTEPPSTDPPTDPDPPQTEYGRFLIRKEITQDHPTPTSTLSFNPNNWDVADEPAPAVFRGGRPQVLGVQCTVDTANSTITFLPDDQITDALPHGVVVGPEERVYIDYYVTQAVGGENTITVLNPPMFTAAVNIQETDDNGDPTNSFVIQGGDFTANFPSGYMLRIENEQIYLIGSSSYDGGANETTVALYGNQTFQDSFNDPTVYVTSGATPLVPLPGNVTYFTPELQVYEAVARGSKTFKVAGDRALAYRTGTVLVFTDGASTFTDFLACSGAAYDAATDRTTVMLTSGAIRQYEFGSQDLLSSIRPVFDPPTTTVQTTQLPALTQPYLVYRKFRTEPGVLLSSPVDYTINDSGIVVFTEPLRPDEEFAIFYSGQQLPYQVGVNIRASYTHQLAPSDDNGLAGQILVADYSIYSPDSFYYRVETMTNFRGEYAQEIEASASSGSSGPQTENASQPQLFEQGRESLYFEERHLANQDIIARSSLLFYNDAVNSLEDYLQSLDGRAVGNNDGRFLFDGTTGTLDGTANQIDDIIKVSPAPYSITYPPFAVTSIGTYRKHYEPGSRSRFYPTKRDFFAVSAVNTNTQAGDEIADTKSTNITSVTRLHTRLPWAVITESTDFSGPSILKVDLASGLEAEFAEQAETYARPPFVAGMKCVVQSRDGTFINDASSPVTISTVSDYELEISGLSGVADVGTTIYQSLTDDSGEAPTYYVFGRDFGFNGDNGQILYIPKITLLMNTPIPEEETLSGTVNLNNSLTAPYKFPALYGGLEDDDGDLSFPIQTPDPDSEQDGYLATEDKIIHDPSGLIRALTTPTLEGTGDYDDGTQVLTNSGGNWVAPLPEVNDLVRVLDGVNGPSNFVRITAVGADTVTLESALGVNDTGFQFVITVSDLTVSGTGDGTSTTTNLIDLGATFLSSVAVGQTVIITGSGERRQITQIVSDTELVMDPALPVAPALAAYRIDNSLATYGNTPGDYLTDLQNAVTGQLALYPDEQTFILDFLDIVFTDITTSSTGETMIGQPELTDLSASFLTDEVSLAHYVFIQSGTNAGFYQVTAVNSETELEVDAPFAATLTNIDYRVVRLFGVSRDTVDALFFLYQNIAALLAAATDFLTLITTAVPVTGYSDNFATGLTTTLLDARDTLVDARLADIPTTIDTIETVLANTDTLYDKRYTWIDTRINLESGLIVQQSRAVANRIKAQEDFFNELVKLLAVEGA